MSAKEKGLGGAPKHWRQIAGRPDAEKWRKAQEEHIEKLVKLGVFEVVSLKKLKASGKPFKLLNATWAFTEKERAHSNGELEASARVAAGGYGQEQYVDYDETYAPTMSLTSYKILEAEAANDPDIIRECWDISGAYYRSIPKYNQYMKMPPGFETGPDNIWKLLKCMPGTKDAGHCYNDQLTELLLAMGFTVNPADHASFRLEEVHRDGGVQWICLTIHVDDTAAFSNNQKLMDKIFELVTKRFPMKRRPGIGLMVGIKSERDAKGIRLSQITLINKIAQTAGLSEAKSVSTPCHGTFKGFSTSDITLDPERRKNLDKYPYRQLIGMIAYVTRNTRPDAAWICCELQRYASNFTQAQIDALEHLIKFLHGTKELALEYNSGFKHTANILIPVDAGYGTSLINRASHEGMAVYYKGCLIAHSAKKQRVVALSSMESEFMSATSGAKFAAWLVRLLKGFGIKAKLPIPILEDNTAAIFLSEHPSLNGVRSRHMEIRWHWLQEQTKAGLVKLIHLPTKEQVADLLTKPVQKQVHDKLAPALLGTKPIYSSQMLNALNQMKSELKSQKKVYVATEAEAREEAKRAFRDKLTRRYANMMALATVEPVCLGVAARSDKDQADSLALLMAGGILGYFLHKYFAEGTRARRQGRRIRRRRVQNDDAPDNRLNPPNIRELNARDVFLRAEVAQVQPQQRQQAPPPYDDLSDIEAEWENEALEIN